MELDTLDGIGVEAFRGYVREGLEVVQKQLSSRKPGRQERLHARSSSPALVLSWTGRSDIVGDSWITDMSHFDYPEEDASCVPREAVRIATYFASIVEGTVGGSSFGGSTGVRCRRRPGRVPCSGAIVSELHPGGHELRWRCPVCGDNGVISNWAGTRWDPARKAERCRSGEVFGRQPAVNVPEPDEQETIQGTITWDDGSEDGLPKIVTAEGKEYRWAELGRELMIREGWRIRIELG